MPFRLRNSMFQPIIEQRAVRQAGQIVMQSRIASTYLLFHGRSQLMVDHGPCSDFIRQRLIHSRYFFGRILQFPSNGLAFFESIFNTGQRVPIRKFVLDTCIAGGQLLDGLLN